LKDYFHHFGSQVLAMSPDLVQQRRDQLFTQITAILTPEPPDWFEEEMEADEWRGECVELFQSGCYAYISGEMNFPFSAKVPELGEEDFRVVELSEDYENGIRVGVPIDENGIEDFEYILLDCIEPIDADEKTAEAVSNWKYWLDLPEFLAWWKY
jgi:hypothetical protein